MHGPDNPPNRDGASRRRFLQRLSQGIGAATIGGTMLPNWTAYSKESAQQHGKKLGFALVGLGNLSTHQLAPAFKNTEHCRLAGIVTGTPEKEKLWADKYGIPKGNIYNYANFDEIADNPDIDVVYVVLPNFMHSEFVIRAAQAGKHVFCEKPMANSTRECEAMIEACEKAGSKLGIGYRCQFEPHHQECIRLAREKAFGEMKMIEAGFGFTIGNPNQWRLKKPLAGGGALVDVGIYALQACRYLTNEEPIAISAQETKTNPAKFRDVDESLCWTMTFPGGVIAYCSTTYNFNGINRYTAYAEDGWFGLDPAYGYGGIKGQTSEGPIEKPQIDQFANEMDEFAKSIFEDRPIKISGEEGLRDVGYIESIYKSIEIGKTIPLA